MSDYDAEERFALAELGHALVDEGRLDDARAVWEGLATVAPGEETPWRMLAVIAAREARWADAVPAASAALERGGGPALVLLRAEALARTGRLGEALADLDWILRLPESELHQPVRRRAAVVRSRLRKPLAV